MYKIGIDLGGTNMAGGIINARGEIVHRHSIPTACTGSEELVQSLVAFVNDLLEQSQIGWNQIRHIGMGIPGLHDTKSGVVLLAGNLGLRDFDIRSALAKHFECSIYIANDGNCAALAEARHGASKHYTRSLMLTLGTGIGAGLVMDGQLIHGVSESGHIMINCDQGRPCGCGQKGCFEAYASATALLKSASVSAPHLRAISAKQIFDAAQANDSMAQQLIADFIYYLGVGITSLINAYAVDAVVLGGGISQQGERLLTPLKSVLGELAMSGQLNTHICMAALGNDAGIIGAAELGC